MLFLLFFFKSYKNAANYKNYQDSKITTKKLKLFIQIILLLEPFLSKGMYRVATRSEKIKKNYKSQVKMGVFESQDIDKNLKNIRFCQCKFTNSLYSEAVK